MDKSFTLSPSSMDGISDSISSPKMFINKFSSSFDSNDALTKRSRSNTPSSAIKRKSLCFDDLLSKKQCDDVANEQSNASEPIVPQVKNNTNQSTVEHSDDNKNMNEQTEQQSVQISGVETEQVVIVMLKPRDGDSTQARVGKITRRREESDDFTAILPTMEKSPIADPIQNVPKIFGSEV